MGTSRDQTVALTWIDGTAPNYQEWVALRQAILRSPLGLRFSEEDYAAEKSQQHLIAIDKKRIIGGLIVVSLDESTWKLRQVVVDHDYQGQGIGRILMEFVMRAAAAQNIHEIILHSRTNVIGFYELLGFSCIGPEFEEVGIPHQKMIFTVSSA